MTNTVKWYKDYKRSKLYVRYRINGISRDETLSLDWFSNPEMAKEFQINKYSERLERADFSLQLDIDLSTRQLVVFSFSC